MHTNTRHRQNDRHAAMMPENNEKGSIMVLTLLVIVTLTLAGLATLDHTIMETDIIRNHSTIAMNNYAADAALREAGQRIMGINAFDNNLNNEPEFIDPDDPNCWSWIRTALAAPGTDPQAFVKMNNTNWDTAANTDIQAYPGNGVSGPPTPPLDDLPGNFQVAYTAAFAGIAPGGQMSSYGLSASSGSTTQYQYLIYARSALPSGSEQILMASLLKRR
ncbi:MAG: hypothetical protein SWH68_15655 [Thermodesulfobacteriota bacterium]|nr:hypothetical protein [Thermodesulfobacteriota bacterium]